MIRYTSTWKCNVCRKWHTITARWHNESHCPVWSHYEHGESTPINLYSEEVRQLHDIDTAWEMKVRSIIGWENQDPIYKVKCWKCGDWFTSFHNGPGYCQSCSLGDEDYD
jgi:hypothetical protein